MRLFESVDNIPAGYWRWPHVDPAKEWADKVSGRLVVDEDFLDLFERLRSLMGRPLLITSGYRTPEHNAAISSTGAAGPHTTGRACDVRVYGTHAYRLLEIAIRLRFTGIGFGQDLSIPPTRRYLHLDNLTPADGFPQRPNIWSY